MFLFKHLLCKDELKLLQITHECEKNKKCVTAYVSFEKMVNVFFVNFFPLFIIKKYWRSNVLCL